jgi:hypothetical protein
MSKRKKRRARVKMEDATSRRATAVTSSSNEPQSDASPPSRIWLALMIVSGALWVGWLGFLTYVAVSRH